MTVNNENQSDVEGVETDWSLDLFARLSSRSTQYQGYQGHRSDRVRPMHRFSVSLFGPDRPGIVAAVSRVLVDAGCALEDTSVTILRGHFAMMLVVAGPPAVRASSLEAALGPVARQFDLQANVRAITDEVTTASVTGERYGIVAYAADRPDLVARVSETLAARGVGIIQLQTETVGAPTSVYAMHLEVAVPIGMARQLAADLRTLAAELQAEISLYPEVPEDLPDG